jgi:hypothetical protein
VNLKHDLPSVPEALSRLDREIAIARKEGVALLKIIHGYGSSGAGGDIRIAVQARLHQMVDAGQISNCVFGENWSKFDATTWRLLQDRAELKRDRDLGRANQGITIVVLCES